MKVQSVIKVNTNQQNKPNTMQNSGNTFTVKSASAGAFEDCLKSLYHHRDPQKKTRKQEHKPEAPLLEISPTENQLCETETRTIDIIS